MDHIISEGRRLAEGGEWALTDDIPDLTYQGEQTAPQEEDLPTLTPKTATETATEVLRQIGLDPDAERAIVRLVMRQITKEMGHTNASFKDALARNDALLARDIKVWVSGTLNAREQSHDEKKRTGLEELATKIAIIESQIESIMDTLRVQNEAQGKIISEAISIVKDTRRIADENESDSSTVARLKERADELATTTGKLQEQLTSLPTKTAARPRTFKTSFW
jgi:hypothetical protein